MLDDQCSELGPARQAMEAGVERLKRLRLDARLAHFDDERTAAGALAGRVIDGVSAYLRDPDSSGAIEATVAARQLEDLVPVGARAPVPASALTVQLLLGLAEVAMNAYTTRLDMTGLSRRDLPESTARVHALLSERGLSPEAHDPRDSDP